MANRKLIRPSLSDVTAGASKYQPAPGRKRVPPDQTHAENFYYVKQMNNRTQMVLKLTNGEEIRGIIEWYDRDCIKVNRDEAPNLVIFKTSIMYMFKEEELHGIKTPDSTPHRRSRRKRDYSDTDDTDADPFNSIDDSDN